jgi:hypothetical protein
VSGDRLADVRPGAEHQIEHAWGKADLVDDLCQGKRAQWCHLAGFDDDRVARGQSVGDLERDLM